MARRSPRRRRMSGVMHVTGLWFGLPPRLLNVSDFPKAKLHVVTGKGGTGKSTVAASLALALASQGKDVLLCEVEGRQGIARIFDLDPLPYEERRIASGPDK